MNSRLMQQFEFIREIDKVKQVFRHTDLMCEKRKENDAEHSWHIAMMALILMEHANDKDLDMLKVLKMLLIHDLVEIDAGDYIIYTEQVEEKAREEKAAAHRIFGILPEGQCDEYLSLWLEFEAHETKEAKYARVVDRLEPVLQNYYNGGGSWSELNISASKIIEKNSIIADGSEKIWRVVEEMLQEFVEKGVIKE